MPIEWLTAFLDFPPPTFGSATAYWQAEFASLVRPEGMPLRLLLQRLGEPSGPCRAHPDLACDDVSAEVRRHQALGGTVLRTTGIFTTLLDPAGLPYCVTSRDPGTGLR